MEGKVYTDEKINKRKKKERENVSMAPMIRSYNKKQLSYSFLLDDLNNFSSEKSCIPTVFHIICISLQMHFIEKKGHYP